MISSAKSSKKQEFHNLEKPSKPKPPPFYDQAYLGMSKSGSVQSKRPQTNVGFKPYSNRPQDDALSYFAHKDLVDRQKEEYSERVKTVSYYLITDKSIET